LVLAAHYLLMSDKKHEHSAHIHPPFLWDWRLKWSRPLEDSADSDTNLEGLAASSR
jgi:hypothetical protein